MSIIKIKRSAVPGKIPADSDLDLGELAINTNDGKLFLKKSVGGANTIIDVTASSGGGATNLTYSANGSTVTVLSDTGTDATILAANSTVAGVLTAEAQTIGGAKTFSNGVIAASVTSASAMSIATTSAVAVTINTNNSERMRIDSAGNIGIGTIPSAWDTTFKVVDLSDYSSIVGWTGTGTQVVTNAYNTGGLWYYKNAAAATAYTQVNGIHVWYNAPSGTANSAITFNQAMILDAGGNVGIGVAAFPSYKLEVNGSFAATTKSFVIDHPTKEDMKLRYGSLEGPENGVYVRGRLKDSNVIELPDYWTGLINESTITVNLTAIGSKQDLWVDDIERNCVIVGADSPVNCFYTVFAERKDVEKLVVEF